MSSVGGGGGTNGGGNGGIYETVWNFAGGGGGGGGLYGGGGAAGTTEGGGGGGGGGSNTITGTNTINSTASGSTPANSGDTDRGTAGQGGANAANGNGGLVVIIDKINYPVSPIQQTTLLAQPQVAQYSIKLDTDTDVYPTKWLFNGTNDPVGTQWQLRYQSMTDPGAATQCATTGTMTSWGKMTNWGDINLGAPGDYIPLDTAGTNTTCARYFYLKTTINAQNTYSFPYDSSRGPSISDLTLTFTADPSKRLLHGRTFVGGLGMPNDTSNGQDE